MISVIVSNICCYLRFFVVNFYEEFPQLGLGPHKVLRPQNRGFDQIFRSRDKPHVQNCN